MLALALTPTLAIAQPIRPDDRLTPGAIAATATVAEVCARGYARSHRAVPPEKRAAVFTAYGIDPHARGFELDHRVPLELGGSNAPENLWPQGYSLQPWNAHLKDRLEDRIHELVCSGAMSLHDGQALFLGDWITAYKHVFGEEATP